MSRLGLIASRLVRDLEKRGLAASSIRRYLSPLGPIFKLAIRRGIVPTSPVALLQGATRNKTLV